MALSLSQVLFAITLFLLRRSECIFLMYNSLETPKGCKLSAQKHNCTSQEDLVAHFFLKLTNLYKTECFLS